MPSFHKSLGAWGRPEFRAVLKDEILGMDRAYLPLHRAMSRGSHVTDSPFGATVIAVEGDEGAIRVKAGIFFTSIIAGCSCADDPTPVDENQEYCEVRFDIDRDTGAVTVTLLEDPD